MAIVYCDLVNGIDWYTKNVYAAGTTYALNDLVIQSAASGLTSVTARVWKSLQNGNTGNALTEGAWWTLVADGSAAKPFLTIDDATRGLTGGDEWRCAKTADPVALTGSYTFWNTGTNVGKATVSGDKTADCPANSLIGDYTIGFWNVYSSTYSAGTGITTITLGSNSIGRFSSYDGTDKTLSTTYKLTPLTLSAAQNVLSSGTDKTSMLIGSGGWNLSNPGSPVRDGYTTLESYGVAGSNIKCINIKYFARRAGAVVSFTGNIYEIVLENICLWGTGGNLFSGSAARLVKFINCLITYGSFEYTTGGNRYYIGCKVFTGTQYALITDNYLFGFVEASNCNFVGKNSLSFIVVGGSDVRSIFKNCRFDLTGSYFVRHDYVFEPYSYFLFSSCTIVSLPTTLLAKVTGATAVNRAIFNKYNNTDDYRHYTDYGNILSDSSVRHTASGLAWRYEPGTNASSTYPLELLNIDGNDFIEVAVAANSQVTATIWCKKSDADSAFEAQFICKGGQLAGITSDVTAVATDSTDWQQLTIQVTPTEAGVLRFGFQVWGSSTATCHIDDFGVSQ